MIKKRLVDNWQHYKGALGGIWEVWRKDLIRPHFNVPWSPVNMPHCYNALDCVDPDVTYYQGPGWYRTVLDVNNPYQQGRTLLHFEGAGQKTDAYVFKQKVGHHTGGYDEFQFDITEAIQQSQIPEVYAGKIPLAVLCNNSRDTEMIPSDVSDFNLYGGLYRYVNIIYVPAISIGKVHIHTENVTREKGIIKVNVELYNPLQLTDDIAITINIHNPKHEIIARKQLNCAPYNKKGGEELAVFELNDPQLWAPHQPVLYKCRVELESSKGKTENVQSFGLRHFEFLKRGPFVLNGERLLLKGTHRHEDHAGVAAAMTEDMIRTEMNMIKEMGVNFIRLAHYQQSSIVLDLCDELGILVWEEIPWCRGGLGGENFRQHCRDMLTAMITQHYNHPSVILWGMGNENDWATDFEYFDQEEVRRFMMELHDLSHVLDPSRMTALRRCGFCADIVDVYSPSLWAGWYGGVYKEYEESTRQEFLKVDRFIHAEWGADNVAGRHSENPYTGFGDLKTGLGVDEKEGDYFLTGGRARVSKDGDWSETYACDLIDWCLKSQEGMEWLTGTAYWPFKDFSTPVRPDNPIPYVNVKGVVERDFTKKQAYYVFQSYWASEPMIHIYGHGMNVRWGDEGEKKTVKVYSNCCEAELFLNGKSCGVRKRNANDFPAAGLRWDVEFVEGNNSIKAVGEKDGMVVEDSLEVFYLTEQWGIPSRLNLQTQKSNTETVRVSVSACDERGVLCADASNFVRFGITGDAQLLDNRGTVSGSRLVQLTNGTARIFINLLGEKAMVSVRSDGMHTEFVTIERQ